MGKLTSTCGLIAFLLLAAGREGTACGDKFLVIGRGRRVSFAAHPASILIDLNPRTPLPRALRELKIPAALKAAGHKVRSVETEPQLEAALATGKYDLVLGDLSDMTALEPKVGAAPSHPKLLPVIYNPTGAELAAAEREYACVMRSPSKEQPFLAVIDDAMELRLRRASSGQR